MIIKNYKKLASTALRQDALEITEAGYEAIDIERMVGYHLWLDNNLLELGDQTYDLNNYKHVYVIGAGQGSARAAKAVEQALGPKRVTKGVVVDATKLGGLKRVRVYRGTYPHASETNIKATTKIIELLGKAEQDDLVIALICAGASELLAKPAHLTRLELQSLNDMLAHKGASDQEIDLVRKHSSFVYGGWLAKVAYPATMLSLILSDIPGDDVGVVALGPTVPDASTKAQATAVISKYDLPPLELIETPKDKRYFQRVNNVLMASGAMTLQEMAHRARELGYKPVLYSRKLSVAASEIGPKMAQRVKPGEALLACGKLLSTPKKGAKNGSNQDAVLSALPYLPPDAVIVSAASDGQDTMPVGGAISDGARSATRAHKKKINPEQIVTVGQSFKALKKLGDHLLVDKVTAQIGDFILVLRDHDDARDPKVDQQTAKRQPGTRRVS